MKVAMSKSSLGILVAIVVVSIHVWCNHVL